MPSCAARPPPASLVDCSGGLGANISASWCAERGCCYDASAPQLKCFYGAEGVDVTHVHVISSNHFDAGYADLTSIVVNEYFDTYFPRAAAVGAIVCSVRLTGLTQSSWIGWMPRLADADASPRYEPSSAACSKPRSERSGSGFRYLV